ncbi:hypothetical protein LTR66_016489, partial [Elasticomyces elasticus]
MSSRPKRKRKATEKAGTTAWTAETLKLLRADSESPDRSSDSSIVEDGAIEQNDEEFDVVPEEAIVHDEDENNSVEEESSSVATPSEDEGRGRSHKKSKSHSKAADQPFFTPTPQLRKDEEVSTLGKDIRNLGKKKAFARQDGVRSKGQMAGLDRLKGAKTIVYQTTYGSTLQDLYPVLKGRDLWHRNVRDITCPSRKTLSQCLEEHAGDGYPFQKPSAKQDREAGLSTESEENQRSIQISTEEAIEHKYVPAGRRHKIVLGSWEEAQKFDLDHLQGMSVSSVWNKKIISNGSKPILQTSIPMQDESTSLRQHTEVTPKAHHDGWVLNLGAKVSNIAWAPGTLRTQYCAITTSSTTLQRNAAISVEHVRAPAFAPLPPHPASIQIWQIESMPGSADTDPAQMSTQIPPHLAQVLCTDWGDIR